MFAQRACSDKPKVRHKNTDLMKY